MSVKKESIEISYKANMTDLIKKLESMPNVTSKEAKKMVSALDRQLKQAESAAKRSAAASKKAMKASSAAAKRGANDFKKLASSATMVGVSVLAMGAGVIGFTQKLADLTNELSDANAKTGITVETLAGLRLAAEGSGLEFSNLEGGLVRFSKSMIDSESGSKKLEGAFKTLGVSVRDNNGKFRTTNDTFNDVMKSLSQMESGAERNAIAMELFGRQAGPGLIQSGALDNLESMTALAREFGVAIDESGIDAMSRFQRAMAEFGLVSQGAMAGLIDSISGDSGGLADGISAATSGMVFFGSITEGYITSIRKGFEAVSLDLMAIAAITTGDLKQGLFLFGEAGKTAAESFSGMGSLLSDAVAEVDRFNELSKENNKTQEKTAAIIEGQLETEKERGDREEASKKAAKARAKAEKEILQAKKEALKLEKAQQTLKEKIEDSLVSRPDIMGTDKDVAIDRIKREEAAKLLKIERTLAAEIEAIAKLEEITGNTWNAEIARDLAIEDADQAKHQATMERKIKEGDIELEFADKIAETKKAAEAFDKKAYEDQLERKRALGAATMAFASAALENLEQNSEKTAYAAKRMFRLRQAESVTNIAMSTAEGIVTANAKFPGPVGIGLSVLLAATAAAQAGTVLSQSPPTFHMGGLVPGETAATLLGGEAVLDRSTVDSLGGESGVRELQNNGAGNTEIVVNFPYKHIGRYQRDMNRRRPIRAGSGRF